MRWGTPIRGSRDDAFIKLRTLYHWLLLFYIFTVRFEGSNCSQNRNTAGVKRFTTIAIGHVLCFSDGETCSDLLCFLIVATRAVGHRSQNVFYERQAFLSFPRGRLFYFSRRFSLGFITQIIRSFTIITTLHTPRIKHRERSQES